ncbi:MAG: cohesin domain-containing protein [Coriobacteriales bacterium]|nr:cohesin domain-containing protein [Coriobacteriales bacterium]
MIDLPDSLVPLTKGSTEVNAGDTVVVSIYVEKMDDVYGYQFNLHFNRDKLEYSQGLYSDIDEIQTIFAAEKDQYLLIGATKIGDQAGYSGQLVQVCHVEFIAISDFTLEPDFTMQHISVSEANIVTSDLHYLTDTEGWTVSVAVK